MENQEAQNLEETVEAAPNIEADNPAAERHAKDAKKQRLKAKALQETNEELTAQLETANALLTAAHQHIADTELGSVLAKPEGFWKLGNTPATYFDDAGKLDSQRLTLDAKQAAEDYGLQRPATRVNYPVGSVGTPPEPGTTWQTMLHKATE